MSNSSPFGQCTRYLNGHGPRRPSVQLQCALDELAKAGEQDADMYGGGAMMVSFEEEMATLLGKPATLFMPSGTMAQQIALRLWSDASECRRFAMHATSHLELHEQGAYRELHGLEAELVADDSRLMTLEDLESLQKPLAAILWELPQREIGGQLPSWESLVAECHWAKAAGIRRHLDGARLWEAAPHYGRSHAEIAQHFDSVYVSFYKGIGGIAGAVLAGPADFIAEARVWLRRHGGNLISMYPYLLSARAGLRTRLGLFAGYRERARSIASRLTHVHGVRVVPPEPPTLMMHLHFEVDASALNRANEEVAAETGVMLFGKARERAPGQSKVELSIGDGAARIDDDEVVLLFEKLLQKI